MFTLLKSRGELILTDDPSGYPRAKVLAENVSRPPGDGFKPVVTSGKVKWVEQKSTREDHRAKVLGMGPVERFDTLMAEIDALKARLDGAGL